MRKKQRVWSKLLNIQTMIVSQPHESSRRKEPSYFLLNQRISLDLLNYWENGLLRQSVRTAVWGTSTNLGYAQIWLEAWAEPKWKFSRQLVIRWMSRYENHKSKAIVQAQESLRVWRGNKKKRKRKTKQMVRRWSLRGSRKKEPL